MQDPAYLIDIDAGVVTMLDTGETAPITHGFDDEGGECLIKDAVSIVAGPFDVGWLALDMSQSRPMVMH